MPTINGSAIKKVVVAWRRRDGQQRHWASQLKRQLAKAT